MYRMSFERLNSFCIQHQCRSGSGCVYYTLEGAKKPTLTSSALAITGQGSYDPTKVLYTFEIAP